MPNMLHAVVDDVIIAVHTREPPSDPEWDSYITTSYDLSARGIVPKALVITDGGAPGAAQRTKISAVPGAMEAPTAVLVDSPVARGIVTVIGWSGKIIKAFPQRSLDDAFNFLMIDSHDQHRNIGLEIAELKMSLAGHLDLYDTCRDLSMDIGAVARMNIRSIRRRLSGVVNQQL